jgi:ParB family chromosome partitioning protein
MSLKDKAKRINFGALPTVQPGAPSPAPVDRPKTAPGLMMAQAADQRSELLRTNEQLQKKVDDLEGVAARAVALEDELRSWDGAKAAKPLDPQIVRWSEWANRDELNFAGEEFRQLKEEIASAGGNVQPIKVRPLKPGGEHQYEIVFGHRRHRACLELGLPVLALIDNLGEAELFAQMDRENRSRKNLSAWEQGRMYQRALDRGLFPSNRQLAEKVGADVGQVGKALALARLPNEVVEAFASPLDLQFRWAKLLNDAHEHDPEALRRRAKSARQLGQGRAPKQVLDVLLGVEPFNPPMVKVDLAGARAATVAMDANGRTTISIEKNLVEAAQLADLAELIKSYLAKTHSAAQ